MLGRTYVAVFLVVAASCSSGCDASRRADEPVDGWAMARAALVDGKSCYAEAAVLCVTDEAFIDSAIEEALERRWKGTMPTTRRDVEQVIRSARGHYKTSLRSPVGRKAIEERVREVYEQPVVDTDTVPGIVSVDLGAVPGEVVEGLRKTIRLRDSDLIDGFDWAAAEAGRQLAKYATKYPDAQEIRIEVRAPMGVSRHYLYRYLVEDDIVVHEDIGRDVSSESQYVSKPIPGGIETMRSGTLTLGDDDGERCYPPRGAEGARSCQVPDRYAQQHKKNN
ncbi:MAG: hypothetical protein AB1Z98_22435 [Nannocystaceae bacterium]